jgi:hypothetical protein
VPVITHFPYCAGVELDGVGEIGEDDVEGLGVPVVELESNLPISFGRDLRTKQLIKINYIKVLFPQYLVT